MFSPWSEGSKAEALQQKDILCIVHSCWKAEGDNRARKGEDLGGGWEDPAPQNCTAMTHQTHLEMCSTQPPGGSQDQSSDASDRSHLLPYPAISPSLYHECLAKFPSEPLTHQTQDKHFYLGCLTQTHTTEKNSYSNDLTFNLLTLSL